MGIFAVIGKNRKLGIRLLAAAKKGDAAETKVVQ